MFSQPVADLLSADLINRINGFFKRMRLFGYHDITILDLIDSSDRDPFRKLCASEHSLPHLLPPLGKCSNLRDRGHPYYLPEFSSNLHKSHLWCKWCICIYDFIYIGFYFLSFTVFLIFIGCINVRLTRLMNITYLFTYFLNLQVP